jgi:hypothetical protein
MKAKTLLDYSIPQEIALTKGAAKRHRMVGLLMRFQEIDQQASFQHVYISSRPGLGKTHTASEILRESEVPYFIINGATSVFGFGIALAVINYNNPALLSVNVLVDDCDSLFADTAAINLMKNVLSRNGEMRYEKSLSSQINFLSEEQKQAICHFAIGGRMGFCVPTHNMRFIFTSNVKLPTDDEVHAAAQKGTAKSILLTHQNAIRSRVRSLDVDLTPEEHWGWITHVLLNTTCLTSIGIPNEQLHIISDWLWKNWNSLNERSIRTAEKMAQTMVSSPDNYESIWEFDFLK